jgi:heat shock protein HslJ
MLRASFLLLLGLPFCQSDETLTGYGAADVTWHLVMLNGEGVSDPAATISFPEEGKIEGKAPCNSYFGSQTAPYPWFTAEAVGATRMMCEDMDGEDAFFQALNTMTLVDISGDTLILSNDTGGEMVFEAN